jgi:signal transduction histidine kinase
MQIEGQINLLDYQSAESMSALRSLSHLLGNSQEYYTEASSIINEKAQQAQSILQNQIYSQTMMENLINDLLDLAKLESNNFSLSQEYFNLGSTIYEAF